VIHAEDAALMHMKFEETGLSKTYPGKIFRKDESKGEGGAAPLSLIPGNKLSPWSERDCPHRRIQFRPEKQGEHRHTAGGASLLSY
jgi:hypothetical protein